MTAAAATGRRSPADRESAVALAGAAAASAAMPPASTVDSEPSPSVAWRWVVGTHALDLHADPAQRDWRAVCLAAGGALHRARVALAASGQAARVTLLPDAEPTHLARLVTDGPVEVTPEASALYAATEQPSIVESRATPPQGLRRELTGGAHAEGVRLRLIRIDHGLAGILHGPDHRVSWLRAGAALSAVRLTSNRYGLRLTSTDTHQARWRLGDREGWLGVGIGTPYARLHLTIG